MEQTTSISTETVLDQLQKLLDSGKYSQDSKEYQDTCAWSEAIKARKSFLDEKSHPIVFIGRVGVGKSSMIGVLANLIINSHPQDRAALKKSSVLPTGAGKTTVCEIEVAYKANHHGIRLEIDPTPTEKMEEEIRIYAEGQWRRYTKEIEKAEDSSSPIPTEVQRVIQHMTNYVSRYENKKLINPLDSVLSSFLSKEELAKHLVERARLSSRKKTQWIWEEVTSNSLPELQRIFGALNQGSELEATLPRKITITLPAEHIDTTTGLEYSFIDTRGLDGDNAGSRKDIQEHLRNPRALIALCSSFNDAPDSIIQTLLRSLNTDAELRLAIPRLLLILIDQGNAEQVNGADGIREYGQELKVEECLNSLWGNKLPLHDQKDLVISFDVLQDDIGYLLGKVDETVTKLRGNEQYELDQQAKEAEQFVKNINDALHQELRQTVDSRLMEALAKHIPEDEPPLTAPIQGALEAIRTTRWASVVYASCRRNGEYDNLNLYAAIKTEAARAATTWLDDTITVALATLESMDNTPELKPVSNHIALIKRQYQEAITKVVKEYSNAVHDEISPKLRRAYETWRDCQQEWGNGSGFKDRVYDILKQWAFNQQELKAHKDTAARKYVPLLDKVFQSLQPASALLHIRHLRKLSKVDWQPQTPVVVVIGANGSGKTTLLQTLRLLSLAYKTDLTTAFSQTMGGTGNLKTWGAPDDEPIEFGVNIGKNHWGVKIVGRDGHMPQVSEYLTENDREVFIADNLNGLRYKEERINVSNKLSIRTLIERGVKEPALRTIANFLSALSVYAEPDLPTLRQGSIATDDKQLDPRGSNALAILRRWYQDKTNYHRYRFVVDGLAAAFPNSFATLDFEAAGNTLVARIYRPNEERYSHYLADEANGLLQLLVLLCCIASAEESSLVAIDEPENGLHPYAIRVFLRQTELWARKYKLTVLFTTHSTVILDELNGSPEQVFVLGLQDHTGHTPVRLDHAFDREWLADFELGDLYEQGNIGSNNDLGESIELIDNDNNEDGNN
jgi:predicted ATPase